MDNNQDNILNLFLALIEKDNLRMSLTIFVNGQIISGLAISTKEYLQLTATQFKDNQETIVNTIGKSIEKAINPFEINEDAINNPKYINIKDVCIIDCNNNKMNINSCLRFKANQVSGFMFGSINPINNIE